MNEYPGQVIFSFLGVLLATAALIMMIALWRKMPKEQKNSEQIKLARFYLTVQDYIGYYLVNLRGHQVIGKISVLYVDKYKDDLTAYCVDGDSDGEKIWDMEKAEIFKIGVNIPDILIVVNEKAFLLTKQDEWGRFAQ
ncbi:MAG: hypothetical protein NTX82_04675 [Candidatus Parcubacteria bacterium]|nr:hypothetical protein [Candidatus Parcubacteria bacterium]